ncbi:MAG: polysaccharide deacetylase family protein [Gemmatimonadota bacterium]|jgi:peptidoglycan/xylan/chitin deacetylase (PgdA/CDA1 family)
MPSRRDPVPRVKAWTHWLGGFLLLGLLGGGVVAAAVLLWENLDVRQLAPALAPNPGPPPDPTSPPPPAAPGGSFSVALLNTAPNQGFFPDSSFQPGEIARWRRLIEAEGGEIREVASLEELRAVEPQELLVLPEAPCLSRAEVAAVGSHLARGGSLVSNWAVGARDEACEWRGWGTVRDLAGARDVREISERPALFLTVPEGTPLSPGLDPGTRIELRSEPSLALNTPGARIYWSDWALNPAPDESGGGADVAASAARTEEGGRTAWFGFRLSQAATPRDSVNVERLVRNGVLWAAGTPVAYPAPWPEGRQSALLLVQDVEAEYQNAYAMADLLEELGLPGTFFPVSQLVMGDKELAQAMVRVGEVGSQTSDHTPVAGLTYQDQLIRLRRTYSEIENWAGSPPAGLRPPEESFDANTLRAWKEAGGRYLLAVNQARSASPELHEVEGQILVLIPRLLKDDYNVFVQDGAVRTDRLEEAFLEGMEKLRAVGGLAAVIGHTQIMGTDRRLNALRVVADTAEAQGDWWIARAGEVAEWWAKRAGVRLTFADSPEGAGDADSESAAGGLGGYHPDVVHEILVEGPPDGGLEGLWIDVILPEGVEELMPLMDGVPLPFSTTEWGMRIPVGNLPAGESRTVTVQTVPPEEGEGGR